MTETDTLSTAELADLLGVSARTVQTLAKEQVIPKAERGRFPLAAVTAYCTFIREDARRGPADFQEERARLTRARADVAEIELAQRRGELLRREDVDAAMIGAFSRVRARLLAIPSKAAPLVAMTDVNAADATLRKEINSALKELSETSVESLTAQSA